MTAQIVLRDRYLGAQWISPARTITRPCCTPLAMSPPVAPRQIETAFHHPREGANGEENTVVT
eukprot:6189159-Pleurochrysis_carterae.AAC.5